MGIHPTQASPGSLLRNGHVDCAWFLLVVCCQVSSSRNSNGININNYSMAFFGPFSWRTTPTIPVIWAKTDGHSPHYHLCDHILPPPPSGQRWLYNSFFPAGQCYLDPRLRGEALVKEVLNPSLGKPFWFKLPSYPRPLYLKKVFFSCIGWGQFVLSCILVLRPTLKFHTYFPNQNAWHKAKPTAQHTAHRRV